MDKLLAYLEGFLENIGFEQFADLDVGPLAWAVGLTLVFLVIYGLSLGRDKALVSLLSIYIALAFDASFPYLGKIHEMIGVTANIYSTRLAVLMVVYLIVFWVLRRSFSKSKLALRDSSYFAVAMVSLAQVGLLIAIITNIIPSVILDDMPQYLTAYFGSNLALAFWVVLPIVLLLILRGSRKRSSSSA